MNSNHPDTRLEVALIVAASKKLLQPQMVLLLCRPGDVANKDRELFLTKLQGDALLLNEEQRLAWGCSLNAMGRVYWAVLPESKAPARLENRAEAEREPSITR